MKRARYSATVHLAVVLLAWTSSASTTWYVSTNGTDAAGTLGTGWADAFLTISNGLAHAESNDTVVVSNGTYNLTTQLVINTAVTLIGTNGQDATIIDAQGGYGVRCMSIDHPQAVVQGFTLRGGNLAWNAGKKGGAILMTDGTVQWCRMEDNKASNGGGGAIWMSGGLVQYCRIVNNDGGLYSGTVYMGGGTLRNCLVANNVYYACAGIYTANSTGVRIESCTVAANAAGTTHGGVYAGWAVQVVNTIVYFNTDVDGIDENYYEANSLPFSYSCSTPALRGTANVSGDPQFVNMADGDYHLQPGSSCTNAGTTNLAWMASGTDLDGNPRIVNGKTDIGCFQSTPGPLTANFVGDSLVGLAPHPVVFTSAVAGADLVGLGYLWDFNSDSTPDATGPIATNAFPAGIHTVSLTVTNAAGESNTYTRADYVTVGPVTNYVSLTGSAEFPYDTWGTAANDVQTAIDAAVDGTLVLVADGSYSSADLITVTKGVTLRSANGRAAVDLVMSADWKQTLSINHADAVVDGFTIRRSATYGGGVTIETRGGVLQNCEVVGCRLQSIGGVYLKGSGALMDRCIIRGNSNTTYTSADRVGGVLVSSGCTLRNSLVIGNGGIGYTGGVANNGTVENCTIVSNTVNSADATACGGLRNNTTAAVTRNCIIADNINQQGGPQTNWYRANGTIEYTCTVPDASAYGSGNIPSAPLFVGGSYLLTGVSPCVNAGNAQPWMTGATDLAGASRVMGSAVDLGAYEFVPPGGSVVVMR